MARARDANFHLGCLVKAYEDCVAIQGTPQEDVAARVDSAKRRDETRRACVALHDDMIAHIHVGTTGKVRNAANVGAAAAGGAGGGGGGGGASSKDDAARKANFFTECYNFTSSVERFKRALDRAAAKDAGEARREERGHQVVFIPSFHHDASPQHAHRDTSDHSPVAQNSRHLLRQGGTTSRHVRLKVFGRNASTRERPVAT